MQVQRINVSVVKGNEVDEEVDLEQLFNKADTAIAPMQVLEDEPKDRAENLIDGKSVQRQTAKEHFICGTG